MSENGSERRRPAGVIVIALLWGLQALAGAALLVFLDVSELLPTGGVPVLIGVVVGLAAVSIGLLLGREAARGVALVLAPLLLVASIIQFAPHRPGLHVLLWMTGLSAFFLLSPRALAFFRSEAVVARESGPRLVLRWSALLALPLLSGLLLLWSAHADARAREDRLRASLKESERIVEEMQREYRAALDEREEALADAETRLTDVETRLVQTRSEGEKYGEEVQTLRALLADARLQLNNLAGVTAKASKRAEDLQNENVRLAAQLGAWEKAGGRSQDELASERAERAAALDQCARRAQENEHLKEELREAQARVARLEETNARLTQLLDVYRKELGDRAPEPRVQPTHAGQVLAVDERADLVVISIGAEDGVKLGFRFMVSRGSEYVGMIEVTRVEAKRSVARALSDLQKKKIQRGDRITSP